MTFDFDISTSYKDYVEFMHGPSRYGNNNISPWYENDFTWSLLTTKVFSTKKIKMVMCEEWRRELKACVFTMCFFIMWS